jgi:hypothetical protein
MDWGILLGVVGVFGIPLALAILGLTMVATTPGEFKFVRACFVVAGVVSAATVFLLQWNYPEGSPTMRAVIIAVVGALIFGGVSVALDWVKSKEAAIIPDKTTQVGDGVELLLECQQASLPTVGLPRQSSLTVVSPFRFDKEGTIGISGVVTEPGELIHLPEEWKGKSASSARCRLTNYGKTTLFNVEVPIRITFKRIKRGSAPGNAIAEEIINVAETKLPITKIEPGGDAAYIFYIHNQGRDVVEPQFPDTANYLPPGTETRRPVTLIQAAPFLHRYFALWPIRSAEEIILEEEKSDKK